MKNNFYQDVGKKIREIRTKKKISQVELAKKLGKISSTYINLIESGKRKISLENLIQIARSLETDLNFFLEYHHHPLDPPSLLELALNSEPKLTLEQKKMIAELVVFLKGR